MVLPANVHQAFRAGYCHTQPWLTGRTFTARGRNSRPGPEYSTAPLASTAGTELLSTCSPCGTQLFALGLRIRELLSDSPDDATYRDVCSNLDALRTNAQCLAIHQAASRCVRAARPALDRVARIAQRDLLQTALASLATLDALCALAVEIEESLSHHGMRVPAMHATIPVFEREMVSLTVQHNLQRDESLRLTEVRRVRSIVEAEDRGQAVLAILDEVLRGLLNAEGVGPALRRMVRRRPEKVVTTPPASCGENRSHAFFQLATILTLSSPSHGH